MATKSGIIQLTKNLKKATVLDPDLLAASFTKHAGRLYFAGQRVSDTNALNCIWSLSR